MVRKEVENQTVGMKEGAARGDIRSEEMAFLGKTVKRSGKEGNSAGMVRGSEAAKKNEQEENPMEVDKENERKRKTLSDDSREEEVGADEASAERGKKGVESKTEADTRSGKPNKKNNRNAKKNRDSSI